MAASARLHSESLQERKRSPSRYYAPGYHLPISAPPAAAALNVAHRGGGPGPSPARRRTLTPSTVQGFSSASQLEITEVKFCCKEGPQENHTQRFSLRDCEALLRRGNKLILKIVTSMEFFGSYVVSLTFVPMFRSRERFGHFRATGTTKGTRELWLSIKIPPNFPIGKFNTHLALSLKGGTEVLTHLHQQCIVILFNPWNPDDDSYMSSQSDIQEYVLNDVGTIWRGTHRQIVPLIWEYGQHSQAVQPWIRLHV